MALNPFCESTYPLTRYVFPDEVTKYSPGEKAALGNLAVAGDFRWSRTKSHAASSAMIFANSGSLEYWCFGGPTSVPRMAKPTTTVRHPPPIFTPFGSDPRPVRTVLLEDGPPNPEPAFRVEVRLLLLPYRRENRVVGVCSWPCDRRRRLGGFIEKVKWVGGVLIWRLGTRRRHLYSLRTVRAGDDLTCKPWIVGDWFRAVRATYCVHGRYPLPNFRSGDLTLRVVQIVGVAIQMATVIPDISLIRLAKHALLQAGGPQHGESRRHFCSPERGSQVFRHATPSRQTINRRLSPIYRRRGVSQQRRGRESSAPSFSIRSNRHFGQESQLADHSASIEDPGNNCVADSRVIFWW